MSDMRITKFEQSALLFSTYGKRVAVDFGVLTPSARMAEIGGVEGSVVSHKHGDHFSEDHLRKLAAPVHAPAEVAALLEGKLSEVRTFNFREPFVVADIEFTPVQADHGPKVSAPVQNFGFVIRVSGCRVYFVGDAAIPGPSPAGKFDLVALPISGSGFVFDPVEALDFLRSIGHRGQVLPLHYHGPSEPDCLKRFEAASKDWCTVNVLDVGESMEV